MGLTDFGRSLNLRGGNKVIAGEVIRREKGNQLDVNRRCCFCWFFGRREISGEVLYLHSFFEGIKELVFESLHCEKVPLATEGDVCMAGLTTLSDVANLFMIEEPEAHACYQCRKCSP